MSLKSLQPSISCVVACSADRERAAVGISPERLPGHLQRPLQRQESQQLKVSSGKLGNRFQAYACAGTHVIAYPCMT